MRIGPSLLLAVVVGLGLLPGAAVAQIGNDLVLLDEKQVGRLNETAAEHYARGLKFIDRVDYLVACQSFERASQAQPGHIDLAFLVANLAKENARRTHATESDEYFQIALNALDRILRRTDLDTLTQRRAEQLKAMIDREFRSRGDRDTRRLQTGMVINLQIAAQLNLEPDVLQGRPRRTNTDPRAPFNARSLSASGPAGVGLGPTPTAAPAGGAPATSPFGAAGPTASPASPFGGATGGSPFGAAATPPAAAPGASPFGAAAPPAAAAAPGASPFGAAAAPPATTEPGAMPQPVSPFQ